MKSTSLKSTLAVIATQLTLIVAACIAGYHFTREFSLIPKAVMQLPQVFVSHSEQWQVVTAFFLAYLIQTVVFALVTKSHAFASIKRFCNEYICYLFVYTTVSLYLFLATTMNYDPQFIAAIGLFSTILYLVAFILFQTFTTPLNFGQSIGLTIVGLLKRMVSISGVLALVYFCVPLMLGVAFTKDRDIANQITQVRIWFNPVSDTDWGFKTVFPEVVFHQPVLAKQAPNDDDSLYVLERFGKIYKMSLSQKREKELVLDISENLGEVEVENGLVGMAFHPQFNNRDNSHQFVYLYYTDTRPQGSQVNRLSRFDLSMDDVDSRGDSELVILSLDRTEDGFHNGGSVEFGNDGYLYVGIGEGVHTKEDKSATDTFSAGILRLDVDMNESRSVAVKPFKYGIAENYLVPNDNPFLDRDDIRDEFWVLGLRNPFRFTFDEKTQDIWVGDIGSTIWEEVNLIEKGSHYQFPYHEGVLDESKAVLNPYNLPEKVPVYTYQHTAYDRAVIGGVVNRSSNYPNLENKYIFADNYSAKVFAMPSDQAQVAEVELLARANQFAQRGVSSLTQLRSGEILITTLGAASEPGGEVLELVKAADSNVSAAEEKEEKIPDGYDEKITASLFAVNCSRCHGVTGDGNGPDAPHLGVKLPDLTSPLYGFNTSSEDIKAIIELGGVGVGKSPLMPPWKGFLKPHEIEHLVIYVESLPDKHHKH